MVGTRPKNKLGRIPHGTKIDLSSLPKKKKIPVRRKVTMEEAASPTNSGESKKDSPPGADIDLLLGLNAEDLAGPTLLEKEQEEHGEAQTPCSEKKTATPEKEKSSSSAKEKKRPLSAAALRKIKAESSAAASSPAGATEETSEKDEEEVQSSEPEKSGEEEKDEEEEEAEVEEDEDDEPPAKRVKTPTPAKEEEVLTEAPAGIAERSINAPKKLDFKALAKLGVEKEVRAKFANIGWEKFLDLDTTVYSELVREFFKDLKIRSRGGDGVLSLEFTLVGKRETMNPNQINSELDITDLRYMITDEFRAVTKQIPVLNKVQMNQMWALVAKKEVFTSDKARATSLKSPALRICHRILALNFFGKKDSGNTVSTNELYILWCMETKQELNFGGLVAGQLKSILTKPNQRMSLGFIPTLLAIKRRNIEDMAVLTLEKSGVLDLASLSRMFTILKDVKGKAKMVEKEVKPPARPARPAARSRQTSSTTETPAQAIDTPEAALVKLQMTVDEIQQALYAYFEHVRFRYPPGSP